MKTIWLIGCGNIGFRHLQALLSAKEPAEIVVIEPSATAHERITAEIAKQEPGGHQVRLETALPKTGRADLVIVATSAPPRAAIVRDLARQNPPRIVILEKILAQTDAELDAIAADLATAGSLAYVNCPRRHFPGYQALRSRLADDRPLSLTVSGSNFGLGSNAIHFLDLLEYLNDSGLVRVDATQLDAGSKASKRSGFQEIYGTLSAQLDNGASLHVTCKDEEQPSLGIKVATASGQCFSIDEAGSSMTSPDKEVEPFATRFVSQTPEIYADAIAGRCNLPTLDDSLRQHRLYLAALRSHFALAADQPIPVS